MANATKRHVAVGADGSVERYGARDEERRGEGERDWAGHWSGVVNFLVFFFF